MPEDIDDTVDMIKTQLNNYRTLVDDIFTNESERILILADGLDEWTPPTSNRQPQYHGIPTSRFARDSTILTTSRPSSRGILNLKSSGYDLKVTLFGLSYISVRPMTEKYMKLFNKTSGVAAFNRALSNLPFKDIHNAPMLLQQIIWLYCNDYAIGHSRSSVYVHIVNVVLAWEHERRGAYPKLQSSNFETSPLPKSFDKFGRFQDNQELLLLIGKIAYHAYIQKRDSVSSLVFGRNKLKQLGVSAEDIFAILRTGILTEVNCADPTYEKSQLSFIHTSYIEFFASLYICSCYLWKISDAHFSGNPLTILRDLIAVTQEMCAAEILRLENILIMICGLVPGLTEHVCECIYKVTLSDKNITALVALKIQKLIFDCLSEHNSVDQETKIELHHIYMQQHVDEEVLEMYFRYLVPTRIETCTIRFSGLSHDQNSLLSTILSQAVSLQTLEIHNIYCTKVNCEGHTIDLTNHRELKSIKLKGSTLSVSGINHACLRSGDIRNLSHEQYSLLLSCFSQAVSMQTLKIVCMNCTKDECNGHTIDLTNHRELQNIKLIRSNLSVSGLNHTFLQSCKISFCELSHEQYSLLLSCLSKAVSLQTLKIETIRCTTDNCEGHIIDSTINGKLQSIKLSNSKISVSGLNHTCLQFCEISSCKLSHEQCSLLSSCLSQAVSLRTLDIDRVECTKKKCESHIIDLTNNRKLQTIHLFNSKIYVSGINLTVTKSCKIEYSDRNLSHEQYASLCSSISHAKSLHNLALTGIRCIKDPCEGHVIDLMNHKQLECLSISNCNTIPITGINSTWLKFFTISDFNLSHEQCESLCSFLSDAYYLYGITLREINCIECIECIEDFCEGHIVDLTNHEKLMQLSISNCNTIRFKGMNLTCLMLFTISDRNLSHKQCAYLCSLLSQAVSLHALKLRNIKCIQYICEGHYVDLTNHEQLRLFSISNCNTIHINGMNPPFLPGNCEISDSNLYEQYFANCYNTKNLPWS